MEASQIGDDSDGSSQSGLWNRCAKVCPIIGALIHSIIQMKLPIWDVACPILRHIQVNLNGKNQWTSPSLDPCFSWMPMTGLFIIAGCLPWLLFVLGMVVDLLVIHFGHGTPIFALKYIKIQYLVASIIIVIDSLKDFEWFWPIPTCLLHFLIALRQSNPSMESRKSTNKIVPQSYHSLGPVETGKFEIKLLITSYHHRSCLSRSMFFFSIVSLADQKAWAIVVSLSCRERPFQMLVDAYGPYCWWLLVIDGFR